MKKILSLLFILILLLSCSESPTKPETPSGPIDFGNGLKGNSNTLILSQNENTQISSIDDNSISVSSELLAKKLKEGTIIVAGPSTVAPQGLLRIVTKNSLSKKNGNFKILTKLGSLVDVFTEGKMRFDKKLFEDSWPIEKNINNNIILKSQINLYGNLSADMEFDNGNVKGNLGMKVLGDINLDVIAQAGKTPEINVDIAEYPMNPIVVQVGIPIVLTPKLVIKAEFNGDLEGSTSCNVKDSIKLNANLNYNDGWKFNKDFDNNFILQKIDVNVSATLKAKISIFVSIDIYELLGPTVGFEPYSKLSAKFIPTTTKVVSVGVDAAVGIHTGWLLPFVSDKTWSFQLYEKVLWSSENSSSWVESFENSLSSWILDANANHSNSGIVSTYSTDGNKSLQLYGTIGSCWGALVYHSFNAGNAFQLEIDVRNGNDNLSGCHPDRAGIGLRYGNSWSNPSQQFINFKGNGDIIDFTNTKLTNFNSNKWYSIKLYCNLISSNILSIDYYINGTYYQTKTCETTFPIEDSNIELNVQEGTAWFDNIRITTY